MNQNVNWLINDFLPMFNRVVQERFERIGERLEREWMEDGVDEGESDDSAYESDDDDEFRPLPPIHRNRLPMELHQLILDFQAVHNELVAIAGNVARLGNFRLLVEGVQRFGAEYVPDGVEEEQDDNLFD